MSRLRAIGKVIEIKRDVIRYAIKLNGRYLGAVVRGRGHCWTAEHKFRLLIKDAQFAQALQRINFGSQLERLTNPILGIHFTGVPSRHKT